MEAIFFIVFRTNIVYNLPKSKVFKLLEKTLIMSTEAILLKMILKEVINIENEVKRRVAIYAPSGGYILCAAHDIQGDVPPENVLALYESAKRWGGYPLDQELERLREEIP